MKSDLSEKSTWEYAHLPHLLVQLAPLKLKGVVWNELYGDIDPRFKAIRMKCPKTRRLQKLILNALENKPHSSGEVITELKEKGPNVRSAVQRLVRKGFVKITCRAHQPSGKGWRYFYKITRKGIAWLKIGE